MSIFSYCFHSYTCHFRSDSTSGLGVCKEDELSWLSSAVYIGGPGDAPELDADFPCPDPSEVSISENHDFSNGNSPNNFAMTNGPVKYKDCSWTSEKSDSYTSFLTGPDTGDSKDGFIPPKQVNIWIHYLNRASVLL